MNAIRVGEVNQAICTLSLNDACYKGTIGVTSPDRVRSLAAARKSWTANCVTLTDSRRPGFAADVRCGLPRRSVHLTGYDPGGLAFSGCHVDVLECQCSILWW